MGQWIDKTEVSEEECEDFRHRLREETKLLKTWFDTRAFDYSDTFTCGLELESWLLDQNCLPAPDNAAFLADMDDPLVVPELSKFNFEVNAPPRALTGTVLSETEAGLTELWNRCRTIASERGLAPVMIGTLPTARDEMLQLSWMSDEPRYRLLNNRLFQLRQNQPLHILIEGVDRLDFHCDHLMLEAACTSLQAHLKINQEDAVRFYNASVLAAGPMVAASANAPFLYGKSLWAESRIPAFEQATSVLGLTDIEGRQIKRVTLGTGYLRRSLLELWLENLSFPSLLPVLHEEDSRLPHLCLQNGTIWRWNRPILGFDKAGTPHLRIEHRVMPAGPTMADTVANLALYFGTVLHLARLPDPPELNTSFEEARANFYACAKDGINARIRWAGNDGHVQSLLLNDIVPAARRALEREGVASVDLSRYFDEILRPRMMTGLNGAKWQRSFVQYHGPNFQALTQAYLAFQESGEPVHTWTV